MDPGVIAIVGIGVGGALTVIHWGMRMGTRHEEMKHRLGPGGQDAIMPVVDDLTSEVARLRERVAVLEKLAIDDDRKLAGEIEKLKRSDPGWRAAPTGREG